MVVGSLSQVWWVFSDKACGFCVFFRSCLGTGFHVYSNLSLTTPGPKAERQALQCCGALAAPVHIVDLTRGQEKSDEFPQQPWSFIQPQAQTEEARIDNSFAVSSQHASLTVKLRHVYYQARKHSYHLLVLSSE